MSVFNTPLTTTNTTATTTTSRTRTAISLFIAVPELAQHVALNLDSSDVSSCVCVCHSWNDVFLPLLWHTFDTHCLTWSKIINEHASRRRRPEDIECWIRTIFEKHGHYIRHFSVHWDVVLEAAARSKACRNLTSLVVDDLWHNHLQRHSSSALTAKDQHSSWSSASFADKEDPVSCQEKEEEKRHRQDIEYLWALLRQNPDLTYIAFPPLGPITVADNFTKEYLFETLSVLKNLRELDLDRMPMEIETVLEALPRLGRLSGCGLHGFISLQKEYPCLRSLSCRISVEVTHLLQLLKYLSGLNELVLWQLTIKTCLPPYTDLTSALSASSPFPQLQAFRLDGPVLRGMDGVIALFVRLFPRLESIRVASHVPETIQALWECSFFLDSVIVAGGADVGAWRERRAKTIKGADCGKGGSR
ncbi:MAG: hypothetical protein J3R72DRAFT_445056 [Linnemannia gamsii]|nr:MAG: hypothetical protein J3R72DRAFT_445056 [Linnemannia gamsii]